MLRLAAFVGSPHQRGIPINKDTPGSDIGGKPSAKRWAARLVAVSDVRQSGEAELASV
jgi:hypothetical protein